YTNLLSFGGYDSNYGENPQADLLIHGGFLFGTTFYSGINGVNGTVFMISANGSDFDDIYDFTGSTNGQNPKGGLCSP
ncbi:MAG: hypothetical protein ACRED1_10285, partial [Limisphaerales bacterium]